MHLGNWSDVQRYTDRNADQQHDMYTEPVLQLCIDIEDAIAHLMGRDDPTDWRQQVERRFCRGELSSFGKLQRMSDIRMDSNHGTSNDEGEALFDFCLKCGQDIDFTEIK